MIEVPDQSFQLKIGNVISIINSFDHKNPRYRYLAVKSSEDV